MRKWEDFYFYSLHKWRKQYHAWKFVTKKEKKLIIARNLNLKAAYGFHEKKAENKNIMIYDMKYDKKSMDMIIPTMKLLSV